jgi:ABC-2 type transport system permease protein
LRQFPDGFKSAPHGAGFLTFIGSAVGTFRFELLGAPNTHFVMLAQAILYRGAGLSIVWPQFVFLVLIGSTLFSVSLARFRKTIGTMI